MDNILRYLYKKRKVLLYMIFVVATLLVFSFGNSYGFYEVENGETAIRSVNLESKTLDNFRLAIDGDLTVPLLTQDNFSTSATHNVSGSTTASATLKANNYRASDTYRYYFYIVANSPFVYTDTTNQQAELLLQISYNGTVVTSSNASTLGLDLGELTYRTSTSVEGSISGWDMTTANFVTIINNKAMNAATDQTVADQFELTLVAVKLSGIDQSANMGKQYAARLIMQKEAIVNPANITYSNSTYTSCTNVYCAINELYNAL